MTQKSELFYTDRFHQVESRIVDVLNSAPDYLSPATATSPRAVGDAIQNILADKFDDFLGDESVEHSVEFARRSMADLAFTDRFGFYYVVDVKTHRLDTAFNMPNLTSADRLARLYEDDKNYFVLLMAKYNVLQTRAFIETVYFVPIEFLSWDCLTIGALGWGQIQIANANVINIRQGYSRKDWMIELCDVMLEFYPKEIEKIGRRIERFERLRDDWEAKPDLWPSA